MGPVDHMRLPQLRSHDLAMMRMKRRYQYLLRMKNSKIKKMALEKRGYMREKKRMFDVMLGVIPAGSLDFSAYTNHPDGCIKALASEVAGLSETLTLKNEIIEGLVAKLEQTWSRSFNLQEHKKMSEASTSTCDLHTSDTNSRTWKASVQHHSIDDETLAEKYQRRNHDLTNHVKCLLAKIDKLKKLEESVNILKSCQNRLSEMKDTEIGVKDQIQSALNLPDYVRVNESMPSLVDMLVDYKRTELHGAKRKIADCRGKANTALYELENANIELKRCELMGEQLTTKAFRYYLIPVFDNIEHMAMMLKERSESPPVATRTSCYPVQYSLNQVNPAPKPKSSTPKSTNLIHPCRCKTEKLDKQTSQEKLPLPARNTQNLYPSKRVNKKMEHSPKKLEKNKTNKSPTTKRSFSSKIPSSKTKLHQYDKKSVKESTRNLPQSTSKALPTKQTKTKLGVKKRKQMVPTLKNFPWFD